MTKAFVTLLYTASYLPGALVLGHTLTELGLPEDTELVVLLATGLTAHEQGLLEVSQLGFAFFKQKTNNSPLKGCVRCCDRDLPDSRTEYPTTGTPWTSRA